jgi:hypothetical protein
MKTLSAVLAAMLLVIATGVAQASNHSEAVGKLTGDDSQSQQKK